MDITNYFAEMPEGRSAKALSVHKLVLDLFPKSKVSLKYKMPTYESENGWFAIANQKHYWSVYTCSLEKISKYLTANPDVKHGKGCINFRNKDDVDLETMKLVVQQAMNG
jgi:uncharacterized protein YdhG (YjbR/CyaY superfamily)